MSADSHPEEPEETVLRKAQDHVLTLTLNRPYRNNATTPAMRTRLFALLREADADPNVRCIVVTGVGHSFWPGEDHTELATIDGDLVAERIAENQPSYDIPLRMTTPIIAAVNGAVAGVGFAFALHADIRVAARGAKWAASFARLGLAAETGISWSLPRHVGWGAAMEILLTAEPVTTEEAYRMGLVQHMLDRDEVLPKALDIASKIAANSPASIRNIREQVRMDFNRGWEESFEDSTRRALLALNGDDFQTAMAAIAEKRAIQFD